MSTHRYDYSLLAHNSFGLDVKTKEFVEYSSVDDLRSFLCDRDYDRPLFHIGGGNNLLFTKDYEGVILHSGIKGFEVTGIEGRSVLVRIGASEIWDNVVEKSIEAGYYGLENLSLIPSEVGAAAVQNIGAYGAEAKDFIESVEVVDLESGECGLFSNKECNFAYRFSNFKGSWRGKYAVTYVTLRLSLDYKPNLTYRALAQVAEENMDALALRNKIIEIRESKLPDPKTLGNAGSFFMNPIVDASKFKELQSQYPDIPHYEAPNGVKIPAGWLIDKSGWRGRKLGNAGVYEKQALVLVNVGNAKPEDIVRLSNAVCDDVKKKFGIEIFPEVNWI